MYRGGKPDTTSQPFYWSSGGSASILDRKKGRAAIRTDRQAQQSPLTSKRSESHIVAHTHTNSDPFGDLRYRCVDESKHYNFLKIGADIKTDVAHFGQREKTKETLLGSGNC